MINAYLVFLKSVILIYEIVQFNFIQNQLDFVIYRLNQRDSSPTMSLQSMVYYEPRRDMNTQARLVKRCSPGHRHNVLLGSNVKTPQLIMNITARNQLYVSFE